MCLQQRRSREQDPLPSQTAPGPQERAKEIKGLARPASRTWGMSAGWSVLSACPSSGYPGTQPRAELSPRQLRRATSRQMWRRDGSVTSHFPFRQLQARLAAPFSAHQQPSAPCQPARPSHCLLLNELPHNYRGEQRDGAQAWHPTRVPRPPLHPCPALTRAGGRRSHCGEAGNRRGRW